MEDSTKIAIIMILSILVGSFVIAILMTAELDISTSVERAEKFCEDYDMDFSKIEGKFGCVRIEDNKVVEEHLLQEINRRGYVFASG